MADWHTLQIDFQAMASPCRLLIDGDDAEAMEASARRCIEEIRRIEHKYSRYRADSVLSRINAAAGIKTVALDEETSALLDFAQGLWAMSEGLFDITSGVLRQAWDFRTGTPPDPQRIEALLPLVGWRHVVRDRDAVGLSTVGMELDFGGFGKEYAADRAAALLIQDGFLNALVNLGGDLHATGPRGVGGHEGQPWCIDIQHPRPRLSQGSDVLVAVPLYRGGLATSGDYERFFIHDGKRYCHVLDPRSGWPVCDVQSVSVVGPSTAIAGAISTIAMLKGTQAGDWLLQQNVDFCLVDSTGRRTTHKASAFPIVNPSSST